MAGRRPRRRSCGARSSRSPRRSSASLPPPRTSCVRSPMRSAGAVPRWTMIAARGTSDHAAVYAQYLIETHLGLPTGLAKPSVTTVYGARLRVARRPPAGHLAVGPEPRHRRRRPGGARSRRADRRHHQRASVAARRCRGMAGAVPRRTRARGARHQDVRRRAGGGRIAGGRHPARPCAGRRPGGTCRTCCAPPCR